VSTLPPWVKNHLQDFAALIERLKAGRSPFKAGRSLNGLVILLSGRNAKRKRMEQGSSELESNSRTILKRASASFAGHSDERQMKRSALKYKLTKKVSKLQIRKACLTSPFLGLFVCEIHDVPSIMTFPNLGYRDGRYIVQANGVNLVARKVQQFTQGCEWEN
jgi:hypothetical protein